MNQESVKAKLIELEDPIEHFELIFTGKASKKVDGFYKPAERTIYIHNKNMKEDNQIIYTAIHEYAHHLHTVKSPFPPSNRCHTGEFWAIFHRLVEKAESMGIYKNNYESNQSLKNLTEDLKKNYLAQNGRLMVEFGEKLLEAQRLCFLSCIDFSDYADRILGLGRLTAKTIMKVAQSKIDPTIGYENMKLVATIADPSEREKAVEAFKSGESAAIVKSEYKTGSPKPSISPQEQLLIEKKRLEKTISSLNQKLMLIDQQIAAYSDQKGDSK